MKRLGLYLGLAAALVTSCSLKEKNLEVFQQHGAVFYASFEQPGDATKVYANEDLLLRWTTDDRVSIFNTITYNRQYRFTGETGDNSGEFAKVETDVFVTGNPISHVVSVYPYQPSTKITEDEVLTLTLPAVQHYAGNTFGLGANTMVSVSEDDVLQYKNVGGFLRICMYGEGVTVTSVTLKGNHGEKLAGKATVTMPLGGIPAVMLANDGYEEITLVCYSPVALGATAGERTDFWFVVPPVTFSEGFTVIVEEQDGSTFTKSTANAIKVSRNKISTMSPFEAVG